MRIISGSAKGHKLKCIDGLNTRPTQDRVKESIFNIIVNYIYESNVLDLFSGTGNLGIEALSRGARFCTMVDKNPLCIKVINQNLKHTKFKDNANVILGDVQTVIPKLKDKFNIIFMDPPYNTENIILTLINIHKFDVLTNDGLIVLERDKKDEIRDIPFTIIREEQYGSTVVSFLKGNS